MEITGYDNDTLTKISPTRVISKFLETVADRWPEMLISVTDDIANTSFHVYGNIPPEKLPEKGTIFISKDEDMEKYSDEMGAKLMENGEATLMLLYTKKPAGIYAYDLVTPEDANEDPFSAWAVRALVEACSGA
jgi:hypothetical protein